MIRGKSPISNSSSRGFTVMEIAMVIVLGSLLLTGSLPLIRSWMSKTGTMANQQRLDTIQQSLTNFQTQHSRIPCPAPFVALDGPGFGRESCALTNGALPVRDLGLPDSFSANTNGFMYIYAVTPSETGKLEGLKGTIPIVDRPGGNSVLPTYVNAAGATITVGATYVVVDTGADGKGAHLLSTGLIAKPCVGPDRDVPNCNGLGTFVSAPFSTSAATWYDDSIIYDTGPPKGTIQQVCTTYMGTVSNLGSSRGWYEKGPDFGGGVDAVPIEGPFVFAYGDMFNLDYISAGYNTTSRPSIAYCKYINQYVQSGGCTSLANGAPYGLDVANGSDEQTVLPPLSHPALPDATGLQGWECNGSSAWNMQTQAYAICCWGG